MIWNHVIFLSTVASLGIISASLCAPALPFIGDYFSANFSSLQFTISLFLVGNALGQFLSGPLSDRFGQRAVLLGGLFVFILASSGCALSEKMGILLACRFFQGMGSSVGPVLSRAIASRLFSSDRSAQVQSYGAVGVGVASILAILFSGYLSLTSWRSNFWLAAALGVILFLWTLIALRGTFVQQGLQASFKNSIFEIKQILRHPYFLCNAIWHTITYGLMYAYIALFPFILMEIFHEKNPFQVGIYSAYMIVFYMLGAFFSARMVIKLTSIRMIAVGISLQLISGLLLFFVPTFLILPALCVFNFSIGIILPVTAANALGPFAGKAVGAASSSLGLFYRIFGSLLCTGICQFSLQGGKGLAGAIVILSIGSLLLYKRNLSEQRVA